MKNFRTNGGNVEAFALSISRERDGDEESDSTPHEPLDSLELESVAQTPL